MIGWIKQETGSFTGGLYLVAGFLVVSAVVTLLLARRVAHPAVAAVDAPNHSHA